MEIFIEIGIFVLGFIIGYSLMELFKFIIRRYSHKK